MQSNGVRAFIAVLLGIFLVVFTFAGGVTVGWLIPDNVLASAGQSPTLPAAEAEPTVESAQEAWQLQPREEDEPTPETPADQAELFSPFWEAWNLVKEQYVDQPVDEEEMMRGAIRGMLDSLGDRHTSYMDPQEFEQANIPMDGEYDGIGAWVDTTADYLTIVSPMPGSPAEKAGLKAGDQVVAVDGEDMTGVPADLVIKKVMGPAGSEVVLTVIREGEVEPLEFTVKRATIVVPSVDSRMLEDNIGYIQLMTFGDDTTSELRKALDSLMSQNPRGLILDLRNNGGGYLHTSVEVASEFIGDGVILYEEYGDGTRDTYEAMGDGTALDIPLIVLVNEGTASASEIVAGALQDHGRAKLVGTTTFGKGSVQNWIPLQDNQGAVRVTIARWLTPDERQIHEVGLTPDVVVELTEADVEAERDVQLEKAIEVLKQD